MSPSTSGARAETSVDRWAFERAAWSEAAGRVAGVDEAGRGPLAGPVVAAAAVLPEEWGRDGLPDELKGLNDSKKLSESKRDQFHAFLLADPRVTCGIGVVDASVIDEINILQATHRAMNLALSQLAPPAQRALVDGLRVPTLCLPQTAIVKGDGLSYSIAAASVIAKVTRDRLMKRYHAEWPAYGFAIHKGYPTPQHLRALASLGLCAIHRKSFAPVRSAQRELLL
ncbi:MAG: ribonuclease HII [Verrucomicrobia bacterium]|nr:ribonuclease HII [Verrucomicrobiota bacterium]